MSPLLLSGGLKEPSLGLLVLLLPVELAAFAIYIEVSLVLVSIVVMYVERKGVLLFLERRPSLFRAPRGVGVEPRELKVVACGLCGNRKGKYAG